MKKRIVRYLRIFFFLLLLSFVILLVNGTIWINEPSLKRYPIRGIDVSHYQGDINWSTISNQNITFAFIKATEGSKSQDEYFYKNWKNISNTQILKGAYHFFSFDSDGIKQAKNYISVVPISENMLPPVVDVEFYGDKKKNKPDAPDVRNELDILLNELEEHYGQKPIIYTTMNVYNIYIKDYYDTYPLWIRNIYYKPFLFSNRKWLFWQYSDKGTLDGYIGTEKYIDMNIFNGDLEAFKKLYN